MPGGFRHRQNLPDVHGVDDHRDMVAKAPLPLHAVRRDLFSHQGAQAFDGVLAPGAALRVLREPGRYLGEALELEDGLVVGPLQGDQERLPLVVVETGKENGKALRGEVIGVHQEGEGVAEV